MSNKLKLSRRDLLKYTAAGGAAATFGRAFGQTCADTVPVDISTAKNTGCTIDADLYPTSPFITTPFVDPLPIPTALRPGYRNPDGTPPGARAANGSAAGTYKMPASTMYTMNGTFPGPRINVSYGQPVVVRYENDLDMNPHCLSRGDFGAPDWACLTHLHNGHTAAESDGQPHHMQENDGGYRPGQWVDSSYLVYAAGGDDEEKQADLWFHDHRMHHTGPNVYKGQVGAMPHYDAPGPNNPSPQLGALDSGDERIGLRLPGVKTVNADGT